MSTPSKILIIRFSSIGDIVLTTPVVRCLKEQTGAEIHYLTKNSFRYLPESNPYIDEVLGIDKRAGEVLPRLKAEKYDRIIDLHNNLRSSQVKLALRLRSHTFHKVNLQKWLMTTFRWNLLPGKHIVDRYMETVRPLGVRNDGLGLDYFIPSGEEVDLKALLQDKVQSSVSRQSTVDSRQDFIAFAIGGAHATKRMPQEKIASICSGLRLPVVLLGGPSDSETGARIADSAGSHVVNACGRMNVHQSASVIRQAALVITHDTGMMHIAAAFQKPIISLWGNTIPEFGMYPYYGTEKDKGIILEVKDLSCRPCSKIGYEKCPKGHFRCMRDIENDRILAAAENVIQQPNPKGH